MTEAVPTVICGLEGHPAFTPNFNDYEITVTVTEDHPFAAGRKLVIWYANSARGYVLAWDRADAENVRKDGDGYPRAIRVKGHVRIIPLTSTRQKA